MTSSADSSGRAAAACCALWRSSTAASRALSFSCRASCMASSCSRSCVRRKRGAEVGASGAQEYFQNVRSLLRGRRDRLQAPRAGACGPPAADFERTSSAADMLRWAPPMAAATPRSAAVCGCRTIAVTASKLWIAFSNTADVYPARWCAASAHRMEGARRGGPASAAVWLSWPDISKLHSMPGHPSYVTACAGRLPGRTLERRPDASRRRQ